MALTIEEQLQTLLLTLCPRVFPDVAPEGTPTPYVAWHMYGGQAPVFVEGVLASRRNAYVQINVWDPSRATCNTLSLQIEAALVAHPTLQANPTSALLAVYDEETRTRGALQDFTLWAER